MDRPEMQEPFVDLIRLLRPQATLWRRVDGTGRWGISFRNRDDLVFCWVARGECQLVRPALAPVPLATGDFVLVRTATPFSVTSDPAVPPEDSEKAFAEPDTLALRVGSGEDRPVTLHGGRFLFDTANEDLLCSQLPALVHVSASGKSMRYLRPLLKMNASESLRPKPGSAFVIARLMELILIEIIRNHALSMGTRTAGMLAGLADPCVTVALRAMHADVAHGWTVAELARLAGFSRSAFAARFREVVGIGPIEYLLDWRMARAKDDLHRGVQTISEIAYAIGFESASAFSTAFHRRVGCSPKAFAVRSH